MKTAYIYVSIYGVSEKEAKESLAILQANAGFVRHELAQVMRSRTVPALTFRLDGSMSYGSKMDELFKSITYSTTPDQPTDEEE